jgi:CDP-glucose 4,6-dehydratase
MGTAHVLEAVRHTPSVAVTIIVTSDKVYAETADSHAEDDRLGGQDPYSASKACAEFVAASFPMPEAQKIVTVRSGNVIGGGDWAADRLLPDFFRSMFAGEVWRLRNPHAIRPWQHVLDPLCGYLLAAEFSCSGDSAPKNWNFGPDTASEIMVEQLAAKLCTLWGPDAAYHAEAENAAPHEAAVLRLNSKKAREQLHWGSGWNLDQALQATVAWYRQYQAGRDMAAVSYAQIKAYQTP